VRFVLSAHADALYLCARVLDTSGHSSQRRLDSETCRATLSRATRLQRDATGLRGVARPTAALGQRRRWANGGLIILPKFIRQLLRDPNWTKLTEAYFRCHYLGSIAAVNFALLLTMTFPFDDRVNSVWLPATALPYFLLYGRDLVRIGYRWRDHALHPALKPDRKFLATHPNFAEVQAFPTAIVYRYRPP
jgi:hypothetical protein